MSARRHEKLGLAAAATAAAAGTLLVGQYRQESAPTAKPPAPAAEGLPYMSYQARLVRMQHAIGRMSNYGADGVWVEETIDKGTYRDTQKTVYMVGIPIKAKDGRKTYDQIVLYKNEGEPFPNRLMIVQGSDEPRYRGDNQVWTNWIELDGSGTDKSSNYYAAGRLNQQSVNSFNVSQNLSEIVMDAAERMLGLPKTDSYDSRLIA